MVLFVPKNFNLNVPALLAAAVCHKKSIVRFNIIMKVGFPTDTIYIKNKRIDLQDKNQLFVFGKGEHFSNCKQTSQGLRIKLISNEEFLPFHHVKFQLNKEQQIFHDQQNFLLLNWKNTQLKNRAVKICDARYTFNKILGHFLFVTIES